MKVLHLTQSFERGGRREAITTLAKELRSLGVSSVLGCLNRLGCSPAETAAAFETVEVLQRRSLFDGQALRRLIRFCDTQQVALVHTHDAASQFVAALVRLVRPRLVMLMTFHRSVGMESARVSDRIRNAFACWFSGAIAISTRERCAHYLSENYVQPSKVVRIPLGIDLHRFYPNAKDRIAVRGQLGLSSDALVLGAIGHFGEEKGLDVVLEAFRALAQRRPSGSLNLVILGEGTPAQTEKLNNLARTITTQRVIFSGFATDVERWYRAFDVFVHGARLESFGLVLPEAMASGLPVVSTGVGGIPDIVRDGQTGYLVPSEAPEQLADAVERLLDDRALRAALAAEARRVALAEFNAGLYAQRQLQLYNDLLAGRRPSLRIKNPALWRPRRLPSSEDHPQQGSERSNFRGLDPFATVTDCRG